MPRKKARKADAYLLAWLLGSYGVKLLGKGFSQCNASQFRLVGEKNLSEFSANRAFLTIQDLSCPHCDAT